MTRGSLQAPLPQFSERELGIGPCTGARRTGILSPSRREMKSIPSGDIAPASRVVSSGTVMLIREGDDGIMTQGWPGEGSVGGDY